MLINSLIAAIIASIILALAVMFTYKEWERMISPEEVKGRYWIPGLLWALFYFITQL